MQELYQANPESRERARSMAAGSPPRTPPSIPPRTPPRTRTPRAISNITYHPLNVCHATLLATLHAAPWLGSHPFTHHRMLGSPHNTRSTSVTCSQCMHCSMARLPAVQCRVFPWTINVTSYVDAQVGSGLLVWPWMQSLYNADVPAWIEKSKAHWVLQRRRRRAARAAAEAAEDAAALAASGGSAVTDTDLFGVAASGGGSGGAGTRRVARAAPSRGASGGVVKKQSYTRQVARK